MSSLFPGGAPAQSEKSGICDQHVSHLISCISGDAVELTTPYGWEDIQPAYSGLQVCNLVLRVLRPDRCGQ
ncbi:hypothetical protein ACKS0A_10541 [Histoplasma ohiense]